MEYPENLNYIADRQHSGNDLGGISHEKLFRFGAIISATIFRNLITLPKDPIALGQQTSNYYLSTEMLRKTVVGTFQPTTLPIARFNLSNGSGDFKIVLHVKHLTACTADTVKDF